MIKIIKGVYGRRQGYKITPVKVGDAPIELDADEEKRLVSRGVACYVEKVVEDDAKQKAENKQEAPKEQAPVENEVEKLSKKYGDMNVDALKAYAAEIGIEIPKKARKADIVALIVSAETAPSNEDADDEPNGDEEAPELSAQLPT